MLPNLVTLIWFPLGTWPVVFLYTLQKLASHWYFFLRVVQVNEFPVNALTGMFVTFMASCGNFGSNTAIQTKIVGKLGWELCSYVGMGYQLLVVIFMRQVMDWVYRGDLHVPPEIEEEP